MNRLRPFKVELAEESEILKLISFKKRIITTDMTLKQRKINERNLKMNDCKIVTTTGEGGGFTVGL